MSEKAHFLQMLGLDLAGLVLCTLVVLLAAPAMLPSCWIGYGIGSLCAWAGFGLIVGQYSLTSRLWKILVFPGYLFRMLLYGVGVWITLELGGNIFLFILGLSVCFGSLFLDYLRR